jgi:hypothetical protein
MRVAFWWEIPKERDHMEELDVNGILILKLTFKKYVEKACSRLIWMRVRANGRLS